MPVRKPVVAGQFYPADPDACRREIELMSHETPPEDVPEHPVAGIVPHAGWTFSGETAMRVLEAIASRRTPATFVLLGAAHGPLQGHAVFAEGAWKTPLGSVAVDEDLAETILSEADGEFLANAGAHSREHALEVQLPLIQYLFPKARVVPITVLPDDTAPEAGRTVGRAVKAADADAVCLGSTDLTHYGASYGFAPKGLSAAAVEWVRDVNDRRMIDLMRSLEADRVVAEARERKNACGAGAVAATLAAARELGAERGRLLEYTTSYDVMAEKLGRRDPGATVGYAGMVF